MARNMTHLQLPTSLELRARKIADIGLGTLPVMSSKDLREAVYKAALIALREVAAEARKGG